MLCFCLVFRIFVIVEDLSSEFQEIDSNIYNDMIDCENVEYLLEMSQFEMNGYSYGCHTASRCTYFFC